MRASFSRFVLSTMLLAGQCLADDELDIPVAAWEIPADATRPDNVVKRLDDLATPNLEQASELTAILDGQFDEKGSTESKEENKPTPKRERQQAPFFDRPTMTPSVFSQFPTKPPSLGSGEGRDDSKESSLSATPRPRTSWKDDSDTFNRQIAATVNGERILNGEVLDRNTIYLKGLREYLQSHGGTQAEYNKRREALIQQDLPGNIHYRLLAAAITSHLSPTQILELHTQVNTNFITIEEPKLMQQLGVATRDALEATLEEAGGGIRYTRKNYLTMACSREFMQREMSRDDVISDDDVRAYYEDHLEGYTRPAKVDWQQIQITYFDEAAKAESLERIRRAQAELQDHIPVADVVRKYSDGSNVKNEGAWKSMVAGTLTDSKLEELLFEMPRGQWSEIYEGPSEFQLVRVLKRVPAGAVPYEEVEGKIREILNRKRLQSMIRQMAEKADIESDFDLSRLSADLE